MVCTDTKSILIHDYKIPVPGIRKKVIWHFSDIHLSEYDALSTEEEVLRAKEASEGWEETRRYFAVKNKEPWEPEQRLPASTHLKNLNSFGYDKSRIHTLGGKETYLACCCIKLVETLERTPLTIGNPVIRKITKCHRLCTCCKLWYK